MVDYFFKLVVSEMDARYLTGVPEYVHSFINGLIYGLAKIGALTETEAENLRIGNHDRLEGALDKRHHEQNSTLSV